MAGWVEGIRRALLIGLVLITGTAIEQAHSVGPLSPKVHQLVHSYVAYPGHTTCQDLIRGFIFTL